MGTVIKPSNPVASPAGQSVFTWNPLNSILNHLTKFKAYLLAPLFPTLLQADHATVASEEAFEGFQMDSYRMLLLTYHTARNL